jgi:hypothetical protein
MPIWRLSKSFKGQPDEYLCRPPAIRRARLLSHVLTHERRLKCSKRIDHAASLIVPETCLLGTIIVDVTVDGLSFSSASCRSYLEPWEH